MTVQPPPPASEVQNFQFKLMARLQFMKEDQKLPVKQSLNLLASASKFGLFFVGSASGFDVIQTASIIERYGGVKKPAAEITDFPHRSVILGAQPSHLDVSCDCQHLAVCFTASGNSVIRVYSVTSFTAQAEQVVSEVRLSTGLLALSWNPGISNMLAACMQDGSAAVYDFKNNSFDISSIPPEAHATCLCWSPKGKQIVIGSKNGALNQFKPDLKIVKAIPPPQGDLTMVSVHWLSNFQYVAVYCVQGSGPCTIIINTPKNQPITYTNYEDITYSNGDNRFTQFYFIHQQDWNVLVMSSANSMEVGVLGQSEAGEWQQWQLDDAARAELPLSASRHETLPVGMALDTSVQHNLPWGENQHLPPMPLLLLLSHEGLLSLFWVLNMMPGAATICAPPTPLQDYTGLHLFTSQQNITKAVAVEEPVEEKPAVPATPQPQPLAFALPSTPPAPQWQVPPPTSVQPPWTTPLSVPKPESKPLTNVGQGSWMASSTSPSSFIPSLSQPTNTSAAPTVTTPATAPPPFATLQSTLTFAPLQSPGLVPKPGAFTLSPTSAITSSSTTTVPAVDAVEVSQAKVDLPIALCTEPSTLPTPDPEVSDESQELKAINEALIQDAMREEIDLFNWELEQLNQRVQNININVINTDSLDKMAKEVESLRAFMKELKETTYTQDTEINSLRNFLLEAFSYIESLKLRIRLQNNPDYISIQSPQGLDPIQSQKMADIKSNLQFVEAQLKRLNSEVADQWNLFQESNKENKETIQIPSLETIYQAMVVHNGVMMTQKSLLDDLEVKAMAHSRKKLLNLLTVSHIIDDSQPDINDTELSKIAKDFLALNLTRIKKDGVVENIEESMSSLGVSDCDFTLPHLKNPQSEIYSEKMSLLHKGFGDSHINYLDLSKASTQNSMFPIVASPVRSGSISSGQPVAQNNTKKSPTLKENQLNSTISSLNLSFTKEQTNTTEESQLASKFSMSSSTSSSNFEVEPSTSHTSVVNFGETLAKHSQYSSPNLQTSQFTTHTSPKSVSMTSAANPPFIFSHTSVSQVVSTPQTKSVTATTSSTKGLKFTPPASTNTQVPSLSPPRSFGFSVVSPQVTTSSPLQQFSTNSGKTSSFTSVVTTSSPPFSFTFTSTFNKIEPASSLQSSSSVPLNPLASLNSLVSGIEPVVSSDAVSSTPSQATVNQPFLFKVPSGSENKIDKEEGTTTPTKNILSLPLEGKQELTESKNYVSNAQKVEEQSKFGGALKNFSFGLGSQKPIFGNTPPPSTPPKAAISPSTETNKSDQTQKTILGLQKTPSAFSVTAFANQTQKTLFDGNASLNTSSDTPKSHETQPETLNTLNTTSDSVSTSTVTEVNLSPSKTPNDTKTSLEKLSAATNVTITKIDAAEKKKVDETKPEANLNSSPLFSSFSLCSPSTPNKQSISIFGGSSPTKPSVTYGITQPEPQSFKEEKKEETKLETPEKLQESSKSLSLFGNASVTTNPTTSFSFSVSTLQSSLPSAENAQPTSSVSSFGIKLPTLTSASASSSSEQTAPTFSFSQVTTATTTTQPFSFKIANAPSTASSAFGFGNLSPFTENKPKTEFSFGQQAQSPASTPSSVFGGFSSKTTDTSTIFGGSSTGENKNEFAQDTSSTVENKSVFGQPLSTDPNTQKGFSFSLSSTTTASQSNLFGSPATTAASFFGQTICSPTSTASSPFGQPSSTTSVFGSTSFGGTSGFGSKPTFGQSGGSFFGQSSTFGSSGGSLFGGASPSVGSGSTVFGSSTGQPGSLFNQSAGTSGSVFGGGSFSGGGQTIGQTGFSSPAFQNKPAFGSTSPPAFGSAPAFGGAATFGGSPTFGSPGKVFGSATPSSPSVFGGGTQQSSTFENLANQNTMTFGNIAQNQSPGFSQTQTAGFGFSSPQNTPSSPGFPPANSASSGASFGGSSFSSWR